MPKKKAEKKHRGGPVGGSPIRTQVGPPRGRPTAYAVKHGRPQDMLGLPTSIDWKKLTRGRPIRPKPPGLTHLSPGWKGPPLSKKDYEKWKIQKRINTPTKKSDSYLPRGWKGPPLSREDFKKWEIQKQMQTAGPQSFRTPRGGPKQIHDQLKPLQKNSLMDRIPRRKSGGKVSAKKYSMNRGGKVASVRKPTRA
jgi:hypothetical protein